MMRSTTTFAAVIFAAVFCTGCPTQPPAPTTLIVTEKDAGQAVQLAVGGKLVVNLNGNVTTGYNWEVSAVDAAVIKPTGSSYKQNDAPPGMVGVPGVQSLAFVAVAPGQTTLQLAYSRPWEKGVAPAQSFQVSVSVK